MTVPRWAGLALGCVVAAYLARDGSTLGLGLLLAAPAFAACVTAGILVGEALAPRPGGRVRTAGLRRRSAAGYLSRPLRWALGGLTGALVLLLAVTTATGSADDMGRAGRTLAYTCGGRFAGRVGPWPGSYYSVPLLAALAVGGILSALTIRRIAARPADPSLTSETDDLIRRGAARLVGSGWGLLVSVPLTGIGLVTWGAVRNAGCGGAEWSLLYPLPALTLTGIGAGASLWFMLAVLSPVAGRLSPGGAVAL